jgi:HemY protein
MKWLLAFAFLVLTVAGLGLWTLKDPGHVEITWLGYEYQSTFIMAIIVFASLFFLFIFVMTAFIWIVKIPARIKSYFHHSKESNADKDLLAIFTLYEAEKFKEAHSQQKKAAKTLSKNPLFLWLSGNLHCKTNNILEAGQCFFELTKNPSTAFLGLKGAIQSALQHADFEGASSLLEEAEKIVPDSPWVLTQLAIARERQAPQPSLREAEGDEANHLMYK